MLQLLLCCCCGSTACTARVLLLQLGGEQCSGGSRICPHPRGVNRELLSGCKFLLKRFFVKKKMQTSVQQRVQLMVLLQRVRSGQPLLRWTIQIRPSWSTTTGARASVRAVTLRFVGSVRWLLRLGGKTMRRRVLNACCAANVTSAVTVIRILLKLR